MADARALLIFDVGDTGLAIGDLTFNFIKTLEDGTDVAPDNSTLVDLGRGYYTLMNPNIAVDTIFSVYPTAQSAKVREGIFSLTEAQTAADSAQLKAWHQTMTEGGAGEVFTAAALALSPAGDNTEVLDRLFDLYRGQFATMGESVFWGGVTSIEWEGAPWLEEARLKIERVMPYVKLDGSYGLDWLDTLYRLMWDVGTGTVILDPDHIVPPPSGDDSALVGIGDGPGGIGAGVLKVNSVQGTFKVVFNGDPNLSYYLVDPEGRMITANDGGRPYASTIDTKLVIRAEVQRGPYIYCDGWNGADDLTMTIVSGGQMVAGVDYCVQYYEATTGDTLMLGYLKSTGWEKDSSWTGVCPPGSLLLFCPARAATNLAFNTAAIAPRHLTIQPLTPGFAPVMVRTGEMPVTSSGDAPKYAFFSSGSMIQDPSWGGAIGAALTESLQVYGSTEIAREVSEPGYLQFSWDGVPWPDGVGFNFQGAIKQYRLGTQRWEFQGIKYSIGDETARIIGSGGNIVVDPAVDNVWDITAGRILVVQSYGDWSTMPGGTLTITSNPLSASQRTEIKIYIPPGIGAFGNAMVGKDGTLLHDDFVVASPTTVEARLHKAENYIRCDGWSGDVNPVVSFSDNRGRAMIEIGSTQQYCVQWVCLDEPGRVEHMLGYWSTWGGWQQEIQPGVVVPPNSILSFCCDTYGANGPPIPPRIVEIVANTPGGAGYGITQKLYIGEMTDEFGSAAKYRFDAHGVMIPYSAYQPNIPNDVSSVY